MSDTVEDSTGRMYSIGGVILIFVVPALGGCLFGFDIGATSYAIVQIASSELSGITWWSVVAHSPALQGIIVSAGSLGAFLGSLFIFDLADVIGRKRELQGGALLYILGAILQAGAGSFNNHGIFYMEKDEHISFWPVGVLLLGRLVYGLAIGITMHAAPTYLAEMGPSSIRGLLVALKEASIVLGILLGYVIGSVFSNMPGGWVFVYASSLVFSVSMLALSFAIPFSSRWLLLKGREDEARESLSVVILPEYLQDEFDSMRMALRNQTRQEESAPLQPQEEPDVLEPQEEEAGPHEPLVDRAQENEKRSPTDPTVRGQLVAGIGLVFLQQVTGQPSVLSYATGIFQKSGLSKQASIVVAAFKLFATCGAALTVERYGRKFLLQLGNALMLFALVVLTLVFGSSNALLNQAILVAMLIYIGGYQIGFGPVTWLIVSEVFPLDVRGQATALSGQTNFGLNAAVQFGVPVLEGWVGLNATFGIFAALTAYSLYFVHMFVLETKGLSLEEIEEQFERRRRRNGATMEGERLLDGAENT